MQDAASDNKESSEYLLNIIRETNPDVLHFSQYCYGSLPVDHTEDHHAHSDVVSWWQAVHGVNPPASDWARWYRDTVTRGLDGSDAVIAPSRWMLSQIEENYGAVSNPAVIYNGRTPQHFNAHAEKDDRVVSIGRLWDRGEAGIFAGGQRSHLPGDHCRFAGIARTVAHNGETPVPQVDRVARQTELPPGANAAGRGFYLRCDFAL